MATAIGNKAFVKKLYKSEKAIGPKLKGNEFKFTIEGHEGLTPMFRTAQWPKTQREIIDEKGHGGVGVPEYGALQNSGEITITAVENIKGDLLKMLREVIEAGKEVNCTIESMSEANEGESPEPLTFLMEDCLLVSDAIDGSTDDTAAVVKPSITITYGWVE
jgi:hypothetical protein